MFTFSLIVHTSRDATEQTDNYSVPVQVLNYVLLESLMIFHVYDQFHHGATGINTVQELKYCVMC